ncbi:MAG: hypothetical protein AAB834_07880 [Patescibacteria group bacterium]
MFTVKPVFASAASLVVVIPKFVPPVSVPVLTSYDVAAVTEFHESAAVVCAIDDELSPVGFAGGVVALCVADNVVAVLSPFLAFTLKLYCVLAERFIYFQLVTASHVSLACVVPVLLNQLLPSFVVTAYSVPAGFPLAFTVICTLLPFVAS